jgi:hypothetical protein
MSLLPKSDPSESKRRQGVTRTALNSTTPDKDMVKPSLRMNDPSQRYALVNIANAKLIPQSVNPALRVLGLFPTPEAAVQHLNSISSQIPECNAYLVETWKWNLIPRTATKTPEECLNTVEEMLVQHYKNIVLNKLDFDERRAQNKNQKMEETVFQNPTYPVALQELERRGITLDSVQSELTGRREVETRERVQRIQQAKQREQEQSKETDTPIPNPMAELKDSERVDMTSPLIRSDQRVSVPDKQNFIWLSVMHRDDEPAYCIYGALETEAESKGYDHFVLRTHAVTHDTTCAYTGSWLYTEQAEKLESYGLATYRLDEQNRIMSWNQASKNRQYSDMEGMTIEADRVIDESGRIVPLVSEDAVEEKKAE